MSKKKKEFVYQGEVMVLKKGDSVYSSPGAYPCGLFIELNTGEMRLFSMRTVAKRGTDAILKELNNK